MSALPTPVPNAIGTPGTMASGLGDAQGWFDTRLRRYVAVALALGLLAGLALWAYAGVKHSLRELRSVALASNLETEVLALSLWIEERRDDVERGAADPRVRRSVDALLRTAAADPADPGAALWAAPARAELLEAITPYLKRENRAALNVIDPSGLVLVSPFREYTGRRLTPLALAQLAPVFKGEARLLRPTPENERLVNPPAMRPARPVVWIEAPVRDEGGHAVAALGMGTSEDGGFEAILRAARHGASGDAFAFDDQARLISDSRFGDAMRDFGVIPQNAPNAALEAQLRDPGGSLRNGFQPELEPGARPRTRLAALAIASRGKATRDDRRGVIAEPYRNILGDEVVGAWKWLARYDFGVAVEMRASEAYAPLGYLEIALAVLLALIAIAIAVVVLEWMAIAGLRQRGVKPLRIGPYTVERQLAEGGMGYVYLAHHALLKRRTALKVLKPYIANEDIVARFEREVRLASRLKHRNTIEIFDCARTRGGLFYYAMEYVDGQSLQDMVTRHGPLPAARAVHALAQVCAALEEAHGKGLIHRDIKPHNIMLCRQPPDEVKVLDFGLIKDVVSPATQDLSARARVLGTPLYMAPERIRNPREAGVATDIYSVGAVAYFALTGLRLFASDSDHDLVNRIVNEAAPRAAAHTAVAVPAALDQLIADCLAKDPLLRPASMHELQQRLQDLAATLPWSPADAASWWGAHD